MAEAAPLPTAEERLADEVARRRRQRRRRIVAVAAATVLVAVVLFRGRDERPPFAWDRPLPGPVQHVAAGGGELIVKAFNPERTGTIGPPTWVFQGDDNDDNDESDATIRLHRLHAATGERIDRPGGVLPVRSYPSPRGEIRPDRLFGYCESADGRAAFELTHSADDPNAPPNAVRRRWWYVAPSWERLDAATPLPDLGGFFLWVDWDPASDRLLVLTMAKDLPNASSKDPSEDPSDAPEETNAIGGPAGTIDGPDPTRRDASGRISTLRLHALTTTPGNDGNDGKNASLALQPSLLWETTTRQPVLMGNGGDRYALAPSGRTLLIRRSVPSNATQPPGRQPYEESLLLDVASGTPFGVADVLDVGLVGTPLTHDTLDATIDRTAPTNPLKVRNLATGEVAAVADWPPQLAGRQVGIPRGFPAKQVDLQTGFFFVFTERSTVMLPVGPIALAERRLTVGHLVVDESSGPPAAVPRYRVDWSADYSIGRTRMLLHWTSGDTPRRLYPQLLPDGRLLMQWPERHTTVDHAQLLDLPAMYEAAMGHPPARLEDESDAMERDATERDVTKRAASE